jgi:hypothetical protein
VAALAGLAVLVAAGIACQVVLRLAGWLLGARPGPWGWAAGALAGAAAAAGAARWQARAWEHDADLLASRQHAVTDAEGRRDITAAIAAARAAERILPRVPGIGPEPGVILREALWRLAGVLEERGKLAGTLRELRRAAAGRLPDGPTAAAVRRQAAEAAGRHGDLDARARLLAGRLAALAAGCERFRDEQDAVAHARAACATAALVLGTPGPGSGPDGEDESAGQAAAIRQALRDLAAATRAGT